MARREPGRARRPGRNDRGEGVISAAIAVDDLACLYGAANASSYLLPDFEGSNR